jgi:DNA mismatch endonuclease (patch repair protein)
MVDTFDRKTRSRIMQGVRTSRTEPEERLASALKALGMRFCQNDARIFGTPDFVFRRARLVVFVDGDFWHGRSWFDDGSAPATNSEFWIGKFERNQRRDRLVDRELRRRGWSVLRVWGSDARKDATGCAKRVRLRLRRCLRGCSPASSLTKRRSRAKNR